MTSTGKMAVEILYYFYFNTNLFAITWSSKYLTILFNQKLLLTDQYSNMDFWSVNNSFMWNIESERL